MLLLLGVVFFCRAAKLLQLIAWHANRIGRLHPVPFQTWEVICDEISSLSEFRDRNVNLITPFVEFWLPSLPI